jgi:hypothetical protein
MGKVTIVVDCATDGTTPMYEELKEQWDNMDLPDDWNVYIVPADEEFPNLD